MVDKGSMDREKFYHPFEPYDIQRQFMSSLYQCIEDGQIGIFESPTGKQAETRCTFFADADEFQER